MLLSLNFLVILNTRLNVKLSQFFLGSTNLLFPCEDPNKVVSFIVSINSIYGPSNVDKKLDLSPSPFSLKSQLLKLV